MPDAKNMKKRMNMPSFLLDYDSFWNPLAGAFLVDVMRSGDNRHGLKKGSPLGLHNLKSGKMIERSKLMEYGAREVSLKKNDILFHAGSEANFYYQIESGSIKMVTDSSSGQEFIQGIFNQGDSFGEPPLFCNFTYPSTAIAIDNCTVMKLGKNQFFELLKNNFDIHIKFDQVLCKRLKYKSMILSDISFYDPEHRITNLLRYLKESSSSDNSKKGMVREAKKYVIPFTRQQLADMSGLRVETVIRTVKKMEEKGKLKIVGRKITI